MPWFLEILIALFILSLIPYFYIGFRLVKSFNIVQPKHAKKIHFLILSVFTFLNILPLWILILYFYNKLNHLFLFSNDLHIFDYIFHFPFWIMQITILEIFLYFIVLHIIEFILKKRRKLTLIKQRILSFINIGLFAFFVFYVSVRAYIDTNHVKITSHNVSVNNLPKELEGLTLALVADVQIDRYSQDKKIKRLQKQIKKINPDFLFFAGDIVTRGKYFIPKAVDALCSTSAKHEKIACLGDHDLWSGSKEISDGLKNCNWKFLTNEHYTINYRNLKILVTGIRYVYDSRLSESEIDQILSEAPEADLKILLVHQPAEILKEAAKKYNYDLFLAGHTHGGQVVFRPFGISLTPTQVENTIYTNYKKVGDLNFIVTNGVGLTMWPLRYQAPAEVVKITLSK